MQFDTEVRKQIGVDGTEFKGVKHKAFDDLLDGIFCFWHWGEEGCWVVGDPATGSVVFPICQLEKCSLGQRLKGQRDNNAA